MKSNNSAGEHAPGAASEVADAARAQVLLQWQPVHSGLASIVETAWRWHAEGKLRVMR